MSQGRWGSATCVKGLIVINVQKPPDTCFCGHQIPGLLSLKRRASVAFVGINDLDDIRNNCCDELFVSGGCVVSDEFVLNPDFITRGKSGVR